ncbi:hypothetical protein [Bradyrhizobium phage BDU-MI-1]|nr:hypothetical protein [Bradyrhizobium phage BDU-MI-1]
MDSAKVTDHKPVSIWQKLNPLWWLVGDDGWNVPVINNGQPYLPEVTNIWLRRFYWFICRNPLMNFVGYVLGVEDKNYTVYGSDQVLRTTGRDATPEAYGLRWAVLVPGPSLGALVVSIVSAALALLVHPAFFVIQLISVPKTIGVLPYLNFWNGKVEAYFGWRPASGGFGSKLVFAGGV